MSTVVITLTRVCAGGDHFLIDYTVNGNSFPAHNFDKADFTDPIAQDDIEATLRALVKLYSIGKTANQIKTGLLAGVTVTVT